MSRIVYEFVNQTNYFNSVNLNITEIQTMTTRK